MELYLLCVSICKCLFGQTYSQKHCLQLNFQMRQLPHEVKFGFKVDRAIRVQLMSFWEKGWLNSQGDSSNAVISKLQKATAPWPLRFTSSPRSLLLQWLSLQQPPTLPGSPPRLPSKAHFFPLFLLQLVLYIAGRIISQERYFHQATPLLKSPQ